MRLYRPLPPAALVLGLFVSGFVAACVATCIAGCLGMGSARGTQTLTLKELTRDEAVLMSCAHEAGSAGEPLWCSDPDSPHCLPGSPAPATREPWVGPVTGLLWSPQLAPRLRWKLAPQWPAARVVDWVPQTDFERLERPPRQS